MGYSTLMIRQRDKVIWRRPVKGTQIDDKMRQRAGDAARLLRHSGHMEIGYYDLVLVYAGQEIDSEILVA